MTHADLIETAGGTAAVARICGVKTPSVTDWKRRGVPADRRPALERARYPALGVDDFGADVAWFRVPDPEWPHPGGRPCIDVAAPAASAPETANAT